MVRDEDIQRKTNSESKYPNCRLRAESFQLIPALQNPALDNLYDALTQGIADEKITL